MPIVTERTHSYSPTTRRHTETVSYDSGAVISYISAPMARMAYENSYDLITPDLKKAMSVNFNSVMSRGKSVEIRNCRVQNHPSRHGTVRICENPGGDFDLAITYRSRAMAPVELIGLTGKEITDYLRVALGI